MKKMNIKLTIVALLGAAVVSCKQDILVTEQPKPTPCTICPPYTPGTADFTKYISIGNSLTAGYQAGALFNDGQQNSFPKILSGQFSIAQGSTLTFNQPDINSVNGYSGTSSGVELGRYILFAADGNPSHALPTPTNPTLPAPYNTAGPGFTDAAFYAINFDKTKLNNFGVPGIILVQSLIPDTGNPAKAAYNPYYARFASSPGVSTIIGDALAAQPSFFTFDLGNNDVLGYATGGGWHGAGSVGLTPSANFQAYYTQAIGALMTNSAAKGVVATIPDVTTIPFFLTIKWNAIPLDEATATTLMSASAFGGYNQVMAGLAGALSANPGLFGLDKANADPIAAQIATRYVNFSAGSNNAILIKDETLIDMGPFFDGLLSLQQITTEIRAALTPYQLIRQATSADLIPLTAGGILGKTVGGNPLYVNGVSVPLEDKYVLIKQEIDSIKSSTTSFNSIINSVASANSDRIAVADVNAAFTSFATYGAIVADGVMITPDFTPPFGAFSEDGVHPNSRGYAYMANIFIDAINAKFGAKVPHASLADHSGVGLPIVP